MCKFIYVFIEYSKKFINPYILCNWFIAALSVRPNTGELTVCEGTEVVLTCEVTYHGYKAPVLEWYNHEGVLLPSNVSVGNKLVSVLFLYQK